MYSDSINKLIKELKKLPSVGQKMAERFVFHWLAKGKKDVDEMRQALEELLKRVKSCEVCWNFSETSPCPICSDGRRDKSIVCVVAGSQDLAALEKTNEYKGLYHILRGVVDLADESAANEQLKTKELWKRLTAKPNEIKEVILALNPDLPGETTAMYIERQIKKNWPKIKITRLARGLPMGSDLEYADEITLTSALKNRK